MSTIPIRMNRELFDSAKVAGDVLSRSATQQLEHWARIGREVELGSSLSPQRVADALAGRTSYDDLTVEEQAVVRAEWEVRAGEILANLDLPAQFAATGQTYVDMNDDGQIVRHAPDGTILEVDGVPVDAT